MLQAVFTKSSIANAVLYSARQLTCLSFDAERVKIGRKTGRKTPRRFVLSRTAAPEFAAFDATLRYSTAELWSFRHQMQSKCVHSEVFAALAGHGILALERNAASTLDHHL